MMTKAQLANAVLKMTYGELVAFTDELFAMSQNAGFDLTDHDEWHKLIYSWAEQYSSHATE